jgi:hypothetical protein
MPQVEKLVVANKELVKVYVRKDLIGHDSLSSSRPKQREVCVVQPGSRAFRDSLCVEACCLANGL